MKTEEDLSRGGTRGESKDARTAGAERGDAMNHDVEPIDKSTWGDGPWQTEPDRVEWEHAGVPCLVRRNQLGIWCGYAAVPPGHPSHGHDYNDVPVEVHGGLTYGDRCFGEICHVPKPGEPDDVFWFGFDCGHGFDFAPGMFARERRLGAPSVLWDATVYRTLDYVQTETNRLAEQLAALASPSPPTR